ncbi:MAG: hypothetical protein F4179_04325, partial [Gammaproteobacteria bacterium]|nr:hypothetical protein [Gammaproteobacteria bacterium]
MDEKNRPLTTPPLAVAAFAAALLGALAAAQPAAAQSHFEPMDVYALELAAGPQISADGSGGGYVREAG